MKNTAQDSSVLANKPNRPGEELWLKASVAGGFWAAMEIILGSFVHNLHLPFAGSLLTFIGVVVMASFYRIWPERGLIWRAGLICALMKSVSPSAIILGPMIGIFTEAVLMELLFRTLGNRVPAYLLGGILAMFSTLVHKLVTLLILYGMNLVRIGESLYYFSVKQTGTDAFTLWVLLGIIALVYLTAGITGGWIGYRVGNKIKETPSGNRHFEPGENRGFLADPPAPRRYSVFLLFAYLVMVPATLVWLNHSSVWMAALLTGTLSALVLVLYPGSGRKIRKPLFWVQLFLVLIFASFFLGNINKQAPGWSLDGLQEGLEMCFRAMIIYFGFSAISMELRNPVITRILTRRGFENLYVSVSLAFSVMPSVVARMTGPGKFLSKPFQSLVDLLNEAEGWLEVLRREKASR